MTDTTIIDRPYVEPQLATPDPLDMLSRIEDIRVDIRKAHAVVYRCSGTPDDHRRPRKRGETDYYLFDEAKRHLNQATLDVEAAGRSVAAYYGMTAWREHEDTN